VVTALLAVVTGERGNGDSPAQLTSEISGAVRRGTDESSG